MIRWTWTAGLAALVAVAVASVSVGAEQAAVRKSLMNPAAFKEKAPETYNVKFDTSAGEFVIKVTRAWAPNGADRFYNLVKNGFYDEARFFRAVPNFMVQFGLHANRSGDDRQCERGEFGPYRNPVARGEPLGG